MHDAGQSIRTNANNLGISTRTVLRAEDTDWYGNLARGRPPRCTIPAQRRDILQAAEPDPQTNAVAIRESFYLDVSERTVRRVLHEAGVHQQHHQTPANKEFLTDQHREGRLRFAQQYVDKPEEFGKRVIWTDEKTFSSSCHGWRHCWRKNDTRAEDTDWYGNLARGRPPRCTIPAQRRDILQAAEADPQTNAVAIRESFHLDVSERTVRRVLHEAGVHQQHHQTPANKEFLTDQHREGRLRFAQQYVDKPEEFWKEVIWTDEKTFSSSCHGWRHCWRKNDTR
ncbi:hypothetical protein Pmani_010237 [Petrolisthes manimaculis]|uniref:Transposase Tc1-like domain-containing protein n=1 Tax=Petrolisthes manimaculis TaxID=1843537 RepID=A0AAE1UHJ5_9EUCA|nr:hypothetical protein Pmani_010237 [Petrolisthes manimaculis]